MDNLLDPLITVNYFFHFFIQRFPSTVLKNARFSVDWLYKELYEQWRPFIPADQVAYFLKGGYYSVTIAKNMKLIVLNTNACSRLNFWTLIFNQDLDDQLVWLENQLYLAETSGQNVHLIGHIAPDHKSCNAIWLHNFIRIVARYQSVIKAQFYGHSHLDEVKIYYGNSLNYTYNLREAEKRHNDQHNPQTVETLLDDIKNKPDKAKRIVNTLAEQQIKQLQDLESLQSQLLHLNKDLIYKTKITLNDKIKGYYANLNPSYEKEIKKPISIAFLSPSTSSYDDVNPAYKVYIIEDDVSSF